VPRYDLADGFGEPSYLVYSECVHLLLIFQPSACEPPERLENPDVYVEKWFTTQEHDGALVVGQKTWKQWFLRAKAKVESSRPEVGKPPP